MPVTVRQIHNSWRVVEAATKHLARNKYGKPVDGGGHGDDEEKAKRQAKAINMSLKKRDDETGEK